MGIKTDDIPLALNFLCERLVETKMMSRRPEQLIINEYTPGQGIAAHTDHVRYFGDEIVSISLGSDIVMDFDNRPFSTRSVAVLLRRNSCVALNGEARYQWRHSIAKRKTDYIAGQKITRTRRVSLTFRHMRRKNEPWIVVVPLS
jgi:alkylated DNA repair dioxygenase AlkB